MISYVLTTLNRGQHLTVLRKCLVVLLLIHFTTVRGKNFIVWSVGRRPKQAIPPLVLRRVGETEGSA